MVSRIIFLINPVFITGTICYILVHLSRAGFYPIPSFINHYVTDLFCLPIMIMLSTFIVRFIHPKFNPSNEMVFTLTLLVIIMFELVLPRISPLYTADLFDVVAYLLGTLIYFMSISKEKHALFKAK